MTNKYDIKIQSLEDQIEQLENELYKTKQEKLLICAMTENARPALKTFLKYKNGEYLLSIGTNHQEGLHSFRLTSVQMHELITSLRQELEKHEINKDDQALMKLLDHFFHINNFKISGEH